MNGSRYDDEGLRQYQGDPCEQAEATRSIVVSVFGLVSGRHSRYHLSISKYVRSMSMLQPVTGKNSKDVA